MEFSDKSLLSLSSFVYLIKRHVRPGRENRPAASLSTVKRVGFASSPPGGAAAREFDRRRLKKHLIS